MNMLDPAPRALFDRSPDAILALRGDLVSYMNPVSVALFGEQLGQSADAFLPQELLAVSGERTQLSYDAEGRRYAVFSAGTGQERLLSFSSLEREEQDSPLASGVSGQLDRTLQPMMAAASELAEILDFNRVDAKDAAGILLRSIFQIRRLSRNLSVVSGRETERIRRERETVDLIELLRALVQTTEHFYKGRILLSVEPGGRETLPAELCVPLFEQMLLNLITNSLQHLGEDGHVELSLREKDGRYLLSVRDNGGGMSTQALMSVFAKYASEPGPEALADGAGFGLAAARRIAEAHGGSMLIESREGVGTLVRILLPASEGALVRLGSLRFRVSSGMAEVMTQLSPVLGREYYTKAYFD